MTHPPAIKSGKYSPERPKVKIFEIWPVIEHYFGLSLIKEASMYRPKSTGYGPNLLQLKRFTEFNRLSSHFNFYSYYGVTLCLK